MRLAAGLAIAAGVTLIAHLTIAVAWISSFIFLKSSDVVPVILIAAVVIGAVIGVFALKKPIRAIRGYAVAIAVGYLVAIPLALIMVEKIQRAGGMESRALIWVPVLGAFAGTILSKREVVQ
ncbi:MAG TPA: hypothetical protein VII32_00405 [Thermoanaerobaculia bacterium]